eukprot:SAG25_NODE_6107_length_587_cov_1.415984_1_plen_22_part_10
MCFTDMCVEWLRERLDSTIKAS